MPTTLAVEDITDSLSELLDRLTPGDEIVLTRGRKPVGRLVGEQRLGRPPRQPGNCVGMIQIVSDSDEHLKEFEEYM